MISKSKGMLLSKCPFHHPLADLFIPAPIRLLREAFTHAAVTVYSQVHIYTAERGGANENAQAPKQHQRGFEPGLPRLRV